MIVGARDLAVANGGFKVTGTISTAPKSTNVVRHTTIFTLDLRADSEAELDQAAESVRREIDRIAGEEQVSADLEGTEGADVNRASSPTRQRQPRR